MDVSNHRHVRQKEEKSAILSVNQAFLTFFCCFLLQYVNFLPICFLMFQIIRTFSTDFSYEILQLPVLSLSQEVSAVIAEEYKC